MTLTGVESGPKSNVKKSQPPLKPPRRRLDSLPKSRVDRALTSVSQRGTFMPKKLEGRGLGSYLLLVSPELLLVHPLCCALPLRPGSELGEPGLYPAASSQNS